MKPLLLDLLIESKNDWLSYSNGSTTTYSFFIFIVCDFFISMTLVVAAHLACQINLQVKKTVSDILAQRFNYTTKVFR